MKLHKIGILILYKAKHKKDLLHELANRSVLFFRATIKLVIILNFIFDYRKILKEMTFQIYNAQASLVCTH